MESLVALRHDLHALAEISGEESGTATHLQAWLVARGVEIVFKDLAGHGFLAKVGNPSILMRADLDALPLAEASGVDYAGTGAHHACGHDGHMTMLAGALVKMAKDGGSAYGLFQPAEETGAGAAACLKDDRISKLPISNCFAIHNFPGLPIGTVAAVDGPAAVASEGLKVSFSGTTSHAAEPFAGHSPVAAVASLAMWAQAVPNQVLPFDEGALATVVGLGSGGERYGTSPGDGFVCVTIRAGSNESLQAMRQAILRQAEGLAASFQLELTSEIVDSFPATINDADAVSLVQNAAARAGRGVIPSETAPWSEDFGHFTNHWPGALILLGAGESQPALHSPDYDFPDDLLAAGVQFWWELAQ